MKWQVFSKGTRKFFQKLDQTTEGLSTASIAPVDTQFFAQGDLMIRGSIGPLKDWSDVSQFWARQWETGALRCPISHDWALDKYMHNQVERIKASQQHIILISKTKSLLSPRVITPTFIGNPTSQRCSYRNNLLLILWHSFLCWGSRAVCCLSGHQNLLQRRYAGNHRMPKVALIPVARPVASPSELVHTGNCRNPGLSVAQSQHSSGWNLAHRVLAIQLCLQVQHIQLSRYIWSGHPGIHIVSLHAAKLWGQSVQYALSLNVEFLYAVRALRDINKADWSGKFHAVRLF